MLEVGFTGTRSRPTTAQMASFIQEMNILVASSRHGERNFHHGDCVGADQRAAQDAKFLGFTLHRHPPDMDDYRAFTKPDVDYPPKPYLSRNHDIVMACEVLYAMPRSFHEEIRSGTWSTIRRAKTLGRKIVIIWPDGTFEKNF